MTRAPSVSSSPGRSATSRWQVTGTERSAAGARSVRNTVAPPPRRGSLAPRPPPQPSPRRPIQSAIFRATVRTGHGASGDDGAVTREACQTAPTPRTGRGSGAARGERAGLDGLLLELLQPVAEHRQVRRPGTSGLLV